MAAIQPRYRSDVDLLGNLQRIIDLDSEVPDRALQLAVTQQPLDGSQVLRVTVDQRRFCPPQRICAVIAWIKLDQRDSGLNDPRILPCGKVPTTFNSAEE